MIFTLRPGTTETSLCEWESGPYVIAELALKNAGKFDDLDI